MGDLTDGGTIDYSAMPSWNARMNSSAHDIRRTVSPEPTVIGNKRVTSSSGFTNANNSIFANGDSQPLNSGVLIRVTESGTGRLFWGITQAGLAENDCNILGNTETVFVPTTNLGRIYFKTSSGGCTISVLGE